MTSEGTSCPSFCHKIRSDYAYDSGVYVSLTIDTAHEYVKLGRAEKAASILAHVLPGVRSGSLPPDVVIIFLLRYSEALAASGEVLKA